MEYLRNHFRRAKKDTFRSYKAHLGLEVLVVIASIVTTLLTYKDIQWFTLLISSIATIVIMAVLIFLYNIALAPRRIYKENQENTGRISEEYQRSIMKIKEDQEKQTSQLEAEIFELKQKISKLEEKKPLPLEIEFDEEDYIFESAKEYGIGIDDGPLLIPRIRLHNTSKKAVRDIEVKLVSLVGWVER